MATLLDIIYPIIVAFIRTYKTLQVWVLRLAGRKVESVTKKLFARAGVTLNGKDPSDPQIKNKEFYTRLAADSHLGVGEAYMDGMWECDALDVFSQKVHEGGLVQNVLYFQNRWLNYMLLRFFNLQTKSRAWEVGEKHYDQGNDLFEAFLDSNMQYSCGYWKNADNLEQAQKDKMELIAKKLMLKPGMRVLDIGCGWGGLCKYLAENYHVQVVGCTISQEGAKYGKNLCADLPVDIRLVDYRDLDEKFDRIVSVGMFEHVGPANYRTFFEVAHRCLEDDGIFVLHTIGVNHQRIAQTEPWFHTYIFPNGILPYHVDIPKSTDGLFILEDWQNMGFNYSKTLMAWHENFEKAWPKKLSKLYSQRFYRMWKYYLLMSAGAFRSRKYQLWQVVLTKEGIKGGYNSPR